MADDLTPDDVLNALARVSNGEVRDEDRAVLRGCQDRGWLGPAGEITPEGRFVLDMAVSRGRLRRVEMVVWDDAPWWGPAPLREPRPRTGRFQVRLVEVRLSTLRRLTTRSSCWCCALRLAGR